VIESVNTFYLMKNKTSLEKKLFLARVEQLMGF
jgi:hypothetical protein